MDFNETRAFSVATPPAWNTLPTQLKLLRSTTSLRRQLKTFLFQSAYGHLDTDWWLFCDALYATVTKNWNGHIPFNETASECRFNAFYIRQMAFPGITIVQTVVKWLVVSNVTECVSARISLGVLFYTARKFSSQYFWGGVVKPVTPPLNTALYSSLGRCANVLSTWPWTAASALLLLLLLLHSSWAMRHVRCRQPLCS